MKKLASLVGVGALLLASAGMVFAKGPDIEVLNIGNSMQMITTTADADSGDINFEVERNYHFGEIEFKGGNYATGDAVAISTTEAIANQFTTKVNAGRHQDVEVKNFGFKVNQFLRTDADADSGEVEVEVEHNAHFHEIELGGRGSVSTGDTLADSYTGAWANIFNTRISH